jgi:hypothetical protein
MWLKHETCWPHMWLKHETCWPHMWLTHVDCMWLKHMFKKLSKQKQKQPV